MNPFDTLRWSEADLSSAGWRERGKLQFEEAV